MIQTKEQLLQELYALLLGTRITLLTRVFLHPLREAIQKDLMSIL